MSFTVTEDRGTFTVTETGPAGTFVTVIHEPRQKFRIIRGQVANYKVVYYPTKEKRDKRAQHFANLDGQPVMCEEWTADVARGCDPINHGWSMDDLKEPQ